MFDLDSFSQAVAGVYDASIDVERWTDTLPLLAKIFGGRGAQISVASSPREIAFVRMWGWNEEEMTRFGTRFLELTPVDPRLGMIAARYRAVHCRQFVSDEVLWTSDMYKEALGPGKVEYCMCFTIPIDPEMLCLLSVVRGPTHTPFTIDDCEDFGRLAPHFSRAMTMHGTFQRCREELVTVKALLDHVPLGMMVVDDDELKIANRAARTLLGEGDAVCLLNGRLQGATRRGDADLRDAVQEALNGTDQAVELTLPIDYSEPVRAVVRKLRPASAGMLGAQSEAVALYVTDPRKPVETPEEILQRLFGLTAREASVLRILVAGEDLQSVAARLDIGIETVRSHLKHIMETTGASRQADLVRMVFKSSVDRWAWKIQTD